MALQVYYACRPEIPLWVKGYNGIITRYDYVSFFSNRPKMRLVPNWTFYDISGMSATKTVIERYAYNYQPQNSPIENPSSFFIIWKNFSAIFHQIVVSLYIYLKIGAS